MGPKSEGGRLKFNRIRTHKALFHNTGSPEASYGTVVCLLLGAGGRLLLPRDGAEEQCSCTNATEEKHAW